MSDLISRQAAIDAIHGAIFDFFDICDDDEESPMTYKDEQLLEINKAISGRIKQLPSAQSERPKGEWLYGEHDIAMCDGYRCDQCGFFVPWDYKHKFIDFIKDYHWCPSCGADMRGEQDG